MTYGIPSSYVGWNRRTKYYHRIRLNIYIQTAQCETGTILTKLGEPSESENREPCKKCFKEKK